MRVALIPELCAGGDLEVVNAARRSFDVQHKTMTLRDEQLLAEFARDGHMLPFRHPQLSFECDAPVPISRQLGKHQTGLTWSEVSRRYKTKGITCERVETWRADVKDRKQGSGEPLPADIQHHLRLLQERNIERCLADYRDALALGAAPEQARFLLPQSMVIIWTWTGSLLAFAHLWRQRHHKDAQQEVREFVRLMDPLISERLPLSWAALKGDSSRNS